MKAIILFVIMTSTATAAFPKIDMQNVQGRYLDEKGNAYAEKAHYELPKVKISHENISIDFNKKEKNLIISDPSTSVELEFDFSFLNIFKALSFDNLGIKSDSKVFTVTSESLDLYISPKKYHLEGFSIETDIRNIPIPNDEDITVIEGVIINSHLSIKKVNFSNFDIIVFESLKAENPRLTHHIKKLQTKAKSSIVPMIIRNINCDIKDGKFTGKAKIDSYINLWLRVSGQITTDKENTFLDINLKKAKLGIFSIKYTLLKMLKSLNLDKITVSGSHIIVDLS